MTDDRSSLPDWIWHPVEGGADDCDWPGGPTAVTLFAEDLPATKQFYLDVFELPVVFEDDNFAVFKFGQTLINLLDVSDAPELIQPAPRG